MGRTTVAAKIKCKARKSSGEQCRRWAMAGQLVCATHGGRSPQARANALVRTELSLWQAGEAVDDPAQVLLRLITQSRRRADLYATLLEDAYRAAEKEDIVGRIVTGDVWSLPPGVKALIGHKYAVDTQGNEHPIAEAIRGLVELENNERDRCANYAKTAIAAGLAERMVRVQEKEAALAHAAMVAGLDAAGITGDQRRAVLEGVVAHLGLVS